jgi:hypothetical protein
MLFLNYLPEYSNLQGIAWLISLFKQKINSCILPDDIIFSNFPCK